jgi:hypothetical protein
MYYTQKRTRTLERTHSLTDHLRHSEHMASITHLDLAYKRYPVNRISGLSSKLQVHHRTIGSDASVYACVNFQVQMCAYVSMDDLALQKADNGEKTF